jgi:hypothetical protein
MLPNYIVLENGVIKQDEVNKITYNYAYSNVYNQYSKSLEFAHLRLGVLLGVLGKSPTSILDVGYGNGDFLKIASTAIKNCYGCDISDYPIPDNCTKVDLFDDHYYDVITFFDSLEHFDDIAFLHRLQCEHIFISVPWCHHFSNKWFEKWYHRKPNEHLWHFNKKALVDFFDEQGFEMIYSSHFEDIIRINKEAKYYPNILSCIFRKKDRISTRLSTLYSNKTIVVADDECVSKHIVDELLHYDVKQIIVYKAKHTWDDDRVVYIDTLSEFDIMFYPMTTDLPVIIRLCEEKNATLIYRSIDECKEGSVPMIGLHYDSVYGTPESVITKMITACKNDKEITLDASENQEYHFVYIKDIVQCYLLAGLQNTNVFNCGSESVTLHNIKEILQHYYKNELHLHYMSDTVHTDEYMAKSLPFYQSHTIADGIYDYILSQDDS